MLALVAAVSLACNPHAVFAQVEAATGGAAWRTIGEISAVGIDVSAGLRGRADLHDDVRGGRYTRGSTLPVIGTSIETYDGRTVWARDISGGVHAYDAWYPRARAVTNAYLLRRAYFDPNAHATMTCVVPTAHGESATQLVRVQPAGGVPVTIGVDARTHLIVSTAIRTPISTDVTTFGDYRQTGRFVLPFAIANADTFEPQNGERIEVASYALGSNVAASDFRKPSESDDARMLGGERSTTVPIALEGRQLLVWASIDGKPPMPFILDTGGHAILDSVAAKALDIRAVGSGSSGGSGSGTIGLQYARVRSMRIGDAELRDQPMLVIPYSYNFYERGTRVPLAGILGLEWFERHAVRIDYAAKQLTLTPRNEFVFRGRAVRVPIRFQEDMPLANAAADSHDGWFGVDTGNAGVLVLYGDYLRRTGLLANYAPGIVVHGSGTGGADTGTIQTLLHFAIGGHEIPNLKADFTQMKTGSFSSWTEAGDLGLTVLARFRPTFDYANETMYLEPVAHPIALPPNRAGMAFTKTRPEEIDVVAVRPGSAAAAAGIVAGDEVTEIDGRAATDISGADVYDIVTASAGKVVRLTIRHGTATREVSVTLR